MADHYARAVEALEKATKAQAALKEHYAAGKNVPTYTAALHQAINYGFKAAEAHGLLAVVQRLDDIGLSR